MNPRLKNIIKNKLSEDFSSVSIINYNGSIWFIDAKSKYWYLELYKKTKTLWWRLDFFEDFFLLFSMEQREFVPIIIEWVEEVLNGKVVSTHHTERGYTAEVEKALDGKVVSTDFSDCPDLAQVEEALDSKILSTVGNLPPSQVMVEKILGEVVYTQGTPASFRMEVGEVLKGEVVSTHDSQLVDFILGEKVLKGEVVSTRRQKLRQETQVAEILNTKECSYNFVQEALVQDLIKNMIETTTPDCNSDYSRVEDALNSI
jgi:ribosomal protein L35AE/L33A